MAPVVAHAGTGLRSRLRRMRAGAAALTRDQEAKQIIAYACLRSLIRGVWVALGVVAALELLGLGKAGFGILMAAAGGGALAAIPLSGRLVGRRRLASWLTGGLLMSGLPLIATGAAASGIPAIVFMVGWGLGMALSDVAGQALLNRVVPAASIANVTGLMESGKLLFEGAGSLVAPLLVVTLGIRTALIGAGAVVTALVVLGARSFRRIDDRAVGRVEIVELVSRVPHFRRLRVDSLENIVAALQRVEVPSGGRVMTQGERDDGHWYLVERGQLEVLVDGFLVNELTRGSGFGERALLRAVPRSATVRALSDVGLLSLERGAFLSAVAGPDVQLTVGDELISPVSGSRVDVLGRTHLLEGMRRRDLRELAGQALEYRITAGTRIVTEGDLDDTYQVMLTGRATVLVAGRPPRVLLPGDGFGEIAVLHRIPRTATVVAEEPSTILSVPGPALRAVAQARGGVLGALAAETVPSAHLDPRAGEPPAPGATPGDGHATPG